MTPEERGPFATADNTEAFAKMFSNASDSVDGAVNLLTVVVDKLQAGEPFSSKEVNGIAALLPWLSEQATRLRSIAAAMRASSQ